MPDPPGSDSGTQYDQFIHAQIQKTRRQVKGVAVASTLLILAAALLIYVLAIAVIDSWIVPGGLSLVGRFIAFALMVLGVGGYVALCVVPLLTRRVNPVYAAQAIEQGHPSLKNSLINFLLLRGQKSRIPVPVYTAIERRAASDLTSVPVDSAIDRSPVIRMGYLLLTVVIVFCLYSLLSPKSPLRSFGRVLFPWSTVSAPTRVTIADVQPGRVQAFVGDALTVTALVRGLRTDEPVTLYFTTEDGQSVDQPIEMQMPADGYKHQATLPAAGGLQQTLDYRIEAGDAKAGPFHVEVLAAPSILIEEVRYDFPPYTGLAPRTVPHQGDLKGIEGTRVTIKGRTNVDATSAHVDFNCDGSQDVALTCETRNVSGTFELRLAPDDKPIHTSYQLRFADSAKQLNPQPIRYQIEVLPDQGPEVEITEPGTDNYELPQNGALAIAVRAADRDFGLRRVTLHFEQAGKRLNTVELLSEPRSEPFTGAHVFEPSRLVSAVLKPGDVVQYWAEARDNCAPTANHTQTVKYRLKIVDKVSEADRNQQVATAQEKAKEAEAKNKPPQTDEAPESSTADKDKDTEPGGEPTLGDEGEAAAADEGPPAEGDSPRASSSEADERPDPEGDPADAMEKILDHQDDLNAGDRENSPEQSPQDDLSKSDPQPDEKANQDSKENEKQSDPQQGSDDENQSGAGESGEKKSGSKSGSKSENKPGDKSGQKSDDPSGDNADGQAKDAAGEQQPTGEKGSKQQPGKAQPQKQPKTEKEDAKAAGENQPRDGQQPSAADQAGEEGAKSAQSKSGEQVKTGTPPQGSKADPPGEKNASGKQPGDREPKTADKTDRANQDPGANQRPEQKPNSGQQPGEQPADQPPTDKQPGEQQSGDQPSESPQGGDQNDPAKKPADQQSGDKQSGEKQPGDKQAGGKQPGDKQAKDRQPGDGDQAAESGTPESKKPSGAAKPQQSPPSGGDPESAKGDSGAGEGDQQQNPSPTPQEGNQPRGQKQQQSPSQSSGEPKSDEGNSPSNSPKQSDSQGSEQGDRSGGGKQGGGQKANQPGTGGAGQNTPSDAGDGQANEPGSGDKAAGAGNQESDKPTGESGGEQSGAGSKSRPGSSQDSGSKQQGGGNRQSGDQQGAGAKPPESPSKAGGAGKSGGGAGRQGGPSNNAGNSGDGGASPDEAGSSSGNIAETTNEPNLNDPTGSSTGGGRAGEDGEEPPQPFEPTPTPADPVNRQDAQRATDLVLESLKDQMAKDKVDPELLEKLQWSREDMKKFIDRWEQLKRDAAKRGDVGDEARQQLDNALERLGAARRSVTIRSREGKADNLRELRESRGAKPPPEYREQFEAYTEGAVRRGGK